MAISVGAANIAPAHPYYQGFTQGPAKGRIVSLTLPASSTYATGGFSLTPAMFGLSEIVFLLVNVRPTGPGAGRVFQYNRVTSLMLAFEEEAVAAGGALIETPNATDLSATVLDIFVVGI